MHHENMKTADEIMQYVDGLSGETSEKSLKMMFCFLYKEIMVNRLSIFEREGNRGAVEHLEKIINALNEKLNE